VLLPGRWERPLAWAPSLPAGRTEPARLNADTEAADGSEEMDDCRRCGGPLSTDLDWCPRCFAPVERAAPSPILGPRLPPREAPPAPVYSRWKAGPTSFGAAGRIALTLLVLFGAVAGYPMSRGEMLAWIGIDVPGRAFLIGYVVLAGVGAVYLLARIWKRSRIA
jgi:hypothetical protein